MFDLVQAMKVSGGNITQEDARLLMRSCERTNANIVFEIGAREGGSSLVLADCMRKVNGELFSLECYPKGRWHENIKLFDLEEHATLIEGVSPWHTNGVPETYDVLFIDGNHRTRWCLVDYHCWEPRLRVGGEVIFHDWCGAAGYKEQIQRAVSIILETDKNKLEEVDRVEGKDRGCIAFKKLKS